MYLVGGWRLLVLRLTRSSLLTYFVQIQCLPRDLLPHGSALPREWEQYWCRTLSLECRTLISCHCLVLWARSGTESHALEAVCGHSDGLLDCVSSAVRRRRWFGLSSAGWGLAISVRKKFSSSFLLTKGYLSPYMILYLCCDVPFLLHIHIVNCGTWTFCGSALAFRPAAWSSYIRPSSGGKKKQSYSSNNMITALLREIITTAIHDHHAIVFSCPVVVCDLDRIDRWL